MRALSREQQLGWIERLFGKFEAMYGRLFADMWAGTKIEAVKAEWADDLAGFTGAQIGWALEQCRTLCEMPPTLPKFRALCFQAPREEPKVPLLTERTDPEVARKRLAEINAVIGRKIVQ